MFRKLITGLMEVQIYCGENFIVFDGKKCDYSFDRSDSERQTTNLHVRLIGEPILLSFLDGCFSSQPKEWLFCFFCEETISYFYGTAYGTAISIDLYPTRLVEMKLRSHHYMHEIPTISRIRKLNQMRKEQPFVKARLQAELNVNAFTGVDTCTRFVLQGVDNSPMRYHTLDDLDEVKRVCGRNPVTIRFVRYLETEAERERRRQQERKMQPFVRSRLQATLNVDGFEGDDDTVLFYIKGFPPLQYYTLDDLDEVKRVCGRYPVTIKFVRG